MSIKLHWFLPTSGDARNPRRRQAYSVPQGVGLRPVRAGTRTSSVRPTSTTWRRSPARPSSSASRRCSRPTGTWCEDAWLVTAALTHDTERLKFLVAFRPGVTVPTLAARWRPPSSASPPAGCCSTSSPAVSRPSSALRGPPRPRPALRTYRRVPAASCAACGARSRSTSTASTTSSRARGPRRAPDPLPQIFFGGSSAPAGPVAARHADVYLTWGEPPEQVEEKIAWIRGLAERRGARSASVSGIHTISRDSAEDAWREARRLLDDLDPAAIAPRAGGARAERVRRTAADARAARRASSFASATSSRSPPTCGLVSAWCAVAPAQRSSAAMPRSPTGSRSTTRSASTSSSSPATRTSRRRTGSARASCPSCGRRASTGPPSSPSRWWRRPDGRCCQIPRSTC